MACGYISIIDTGIQLSHLTGKLLYYSQSDVLMIPHGTTMGIPRINDPIYKCEPTPGQLFTNNFGGPPDWVLSPEGDGCGPVETKSWPAGLTRMDKGEVPAPHAEECARLPIPEGCLISEYANGQSDDQRPHPKEVG